MMRNLAIKLVKDVSGATAIEYGLIAALVGVILLISIQFLGTQLTSTFSNVGNKLQSANAG
jgi:pilus assembly protein Flp/PilA